MLFVLLGVRAAAVSEKQKGHRPIARRHSVPDESGPHGMGMNQVEMDYKAALLRQGRVEAFDTKEAFLPSRGATSLVAIAQASNASRMHSKGCPGKAFCGGLANNLTFHQSCWDCHDDYQEFYCMKASLQLPEPLYVDVCAREGQFRGAYCKKFAEKVPPEDLADCFFDGSEYKQIFCEKKKMEGSFVSKCARDADVGPNYCEGWAMKKTGYIECHKWPGFMMLYCETLQNSTDWDAACANHHQVGANYCEDFALQEDIRPDCVKYGSYLRLYCDIKASQNKTVETCATNEQVAGMYCEQLAIHRNGFRACWSVAMFDQTYCAEVTWPVSECQDALEA
jgi:hypothetical protein